MKVRLQFGQWNWTQNEIFMLSSTQWHTKWCDGVRPNYKLLLKWVLTIFTAFWCFCSIYLQNEIRIDRICLQNRNGFSWNLLLKGTKNYFHRFGVILHYYLQNEMRIDRICLQNRNEGFLKHILLKRTMEPAGLPKIPKE